MYTYFLHYVKEEMKMFNNPSVRDVIVEQRNKAKKVKKYCSECGEEYFAVENNRTCPNCGAIKEIEK